MACTEDEGTWGHLFKQGEHKTSVLFLYDLFKNKTSLFILFSEFIFVFVAVYHTGEIINRKRFEIYDFIQRGFFVISIKNVTFRAEFDGPLVRCFYDSLMRRG